MVEEKIRGENVWIWEPEAASWHVARGWGQGALAIADSADRSQEKPQSIAQYGADLVVQDREVVPPLTLF